jgi:hypothetical protein
MTLDAHVRGHDDFRHPRVRRIRDVDSKVNCDVHARVRGHEDSRGSFPACFKRVSSDVAYDVHRNVP